MSARPVSIVVPSLDDRDLLERHLPPLLAELDRRAAGDELLIVDDTGAGVLAPWLAEHFPRAQCLAQAHNAGFAPALLAGVRAARHELVFSMNPDVRVRARFLEPLVEALADARVFAAVPLVLLHGKEDQVESATELRWQRGELSIGQPGLEGAAADCKQGRRAVAYAIGGSCLLRKSEFLALGGFDELFAPFYYEDVDLGWEAWKRGRTVVLEPSSVIEHHHRGTIKRRVSAELVRAVIERNRFLFTWKHLDEPERAREHFAALHRLALDALLCGERDVLEWLLLALERLELLEAARARTTHTGPSFGALLEQSSRPL